MTNRIIQTNHSLDEAVFERQINYLYSNLPGLLAYSFVVAMLIGWMLREAVATTMNASWLGIMIVVLLVRLGLYFRFREGSESPTRTRARWYVVFAGVSGVAWGLAGIMLYTPDQLELQALMLLVLAGMAAASASVLPMYLPAFFVYVPGAMIPTAINMFVRGDQFHLFMGAVAIIFMLGVMSFGRSIGRAFRDSLVLRFKNLDLVQSLKQSTADLEQANRAKTQFLAAASHDLRQPMHALTLFTQLLNERSSDSESRQLAGKIQSAVDVLERLFAALLDISKLDAGVVEPEIGPVNLQNLLDRVANDGHPEATSKGLTLSVAPCAQIVTSDQVLLERILRNLVSNAIRYTDAGHVAVTCKVVGNELELTVTDTGIGIVNSEQERIFEEFTQLANPERDRSKGLGLGLSIVRRLARLLGHRIALESEPGNGSRFSVFLPLTTQPVTTDHEAIEAPLVAQQMSLSVLIVDDDPEILSGSRALLESWGCRVATAGNAAIARELAGGEIEFDAIITDLRLPEEEKGSDLVGDIRNAQHSTIPALLITGDTEPERLKEAQRAGLTLLHKPVAPARMRAWLMRCKTL